MVNFIKFIALLLLVLPALIVSQTCEITVSSTLQNAQENYNVYEGTINNIGSAAASNVLISTTSSLRSVSGLHKTEDGYTLTAAAARKGIDAGASSTFKYKVKKGTNVVWTASCTSADAGNSGDATCTEAPPTAPTTRPTHAPTTTKAPKHTEAPTTTKRATAAPTTTKRPTESPTTTKKATTTKAPTTTKKPTEAPTTTKKATTTEAPTTTKKPVSTTTEPPTTTKKGTTTTAPPATGSGKVCPGSSWWAPAPLTTWQWQLTGTIDTTVEAQMFDIDMFDNTAATIAKLHSLGKVVICYFSTQYENWRPDASDFTAAVLGNAIEGWSGENYVDIRSSVIRNIMTARLQLAASKGCDGVEPDNVDGYENDSGFPITAADQLNFNEFIAAGAHAVGLSVGLKNDVDQAKTLEPYFDWALDEQCKQYDECDTLTPFITAGKAVFNCEYSGSESSVCPYMVGLQFSSIIKTEDLTASIKAQCCDDQTGGCAYIASYQCISSEGATANAQTDNNGEISTSTTPEHVNSAASYYVSITLLASAVLGALVL